MLLAIGQKLVFTKSSAEVSSSDNAYKIKPANPSYPTHEGERSPGRSHNLYNRTKKKKLYWK